LCAGRNATDTGDQNVTADSTVGSGVVRGMVMDTPRP
jgi:hypothetical protein